MQGATVHFLIGVGLVDYVALCRDGRNHSRTFRAMASALRWVYLYSVLWSLCLVMVAATVKSAPFQRIDRFYNSIYTRSFFKDWTDWNLHATTKYLCSAHRYGYGCPLTGKLCYIASIFYFQDAYPFFVAFDNDRDGVNFSFAWGLSRKNGVVFTTGSRLTNFASLFLFSFF